MKKPTTPKRRRKPLSEQHERLFVPFPFTPMNDLYDLRQPDFRPMSNSVVAGGAGQVPVETWSIMHTKLGGSA
jgi:hypothetical protein